MESVWKTPFLLEMKIADIISKQAKHGVQFNSRNAKWNVHVLSEKIVNIDKVLIPLLPKMLNKGTEYKKPFKLNGQFMKYPGEYCERQGLQRNEVGGPFTALWYTNFDPSKNGKVKSLMLDLGWQPTSWNTKKVEFQTFKFRKKLKRSTYAEFLADFKREDREEAEFLDGAISKFMETHFQNKSKNYMKAILSALGFSVKTKPPTFGEIKKALAIKQKWPTSAKITDDSLENLSDDDSLLLGLLKERGVWSHRKSMIVGLLENVREDGRLSGEANPCGTPTARFKHRIVVNIPSAGAAFGKECRSLFTGIEDLSVENPIVLTTKFDSLLESGEVSLLDLDLPRNRYKYDGDWHHHKCYIPAGKQVFVGYDGAGLELRMLAHFMIKECQEMLDEAIALGDKKMQARAKAGLDSALVYREVLLKGDIHSHNQKLAGLPTRKAAKSFIYGFNYGAGDEKLGELVNGGKKEGALIRETFLRENPCIAILIERSQEKGSRGYLTALDGRHLILRRGYDGKPQTHKALNLLLQSAGAIVMKYAMVILDSQSKRVNLKAHKVLDIHDEGQWTCHPSDVPALSSMMSNCVRMAGERLNMHCELASDAMVGPSWYYTH
ncbi:MAG: DNA polymerase [Bacteroidales bacterium]